MHNKRLWFLLRAVIIGSFSALLGVGSEIYRQAPPIPQRVASETGEVLFTAAQIQDGQNTWQSMGGQELGSIWGHGAYVAPDWSADWLHREATMLLDDWAAVRHGLSFAQLDAGAQESLKAELRQELRANRYDPATGTLTLSVTRAADVRRLADYYARLFPLTPATFSWWRCWRRPSSAPPLAVRTALAPASALPPVQPTG